MNQETISKILAVHQEIECLGRVKEAISGTRAHRLCYIREPYSTMGGAVMNGASRIWIL